MATSSALLQPNFADIQRIIDRALEEDVGKGDLTGELLVPENVRGRFAFVSREPVVACGIAVAVQVFRSLDSVVICDIRAKDGEHLDAGSIMLVVEGEGRALMTGERTALNLVQRMCAVATQTARFVQAVRGTKAIILDTRKTMPGLRILDKYAVRAGGAQNHRLGLFDGVLIKDNHIALCGSVAEAVKRAKRGTSEMVEVECDTLAQVEEAFKAGADRILLDNMDIPTLKSAIALVRGRIMLEASGNVTLSNVRMIAETGVDYISIGRLTHSVPNIDIGLDRFLTER